MNKEKSDRIRTKPSKFGWRIYDGSQKVQVTEVGVYVCPICKETSKLVQRQAPGFKNILSICQHGHTCEITKSNYPGLTNWMFDFRIDRCVGNGREITAPA